MQKNFDEALISYIVHSTRPFSTVEDPNFIAVIKAANPNVKIFSRPTLMRRIKAREEEIKKRVKIQLKGPEFVGTTADIWSNRHHGYMGIAAHYIDSAPTAERVAEIINDVHDDFGLGVE